MWLECLTKHRSAHESTPYPRRLSPLEPPSLQPSLWAREHLWNLRWKSSQILEFKRRNYSMILYKVTANALLLFSRFLSNQNVKQTHLKSKKQRFRKQPRAIGFIQDGHSPRLQTDLVALKVTHSQIVGSVGVALVRGFLEPLHGSCVILFDTFPWGVREIGLINRS